MESNQDNDSGQPKRKKAGFSIGIGLALGAAVGITLDNLPIGIGVGLAAAAGALLAPVFLVWAESGSVPTMKGFEIIVIGGLGSIPGSIIAALLLGMVESLGSVFISPAYRDLFGFVFLILILVFKPNGLMGEKERLA